MIKKNSLCVIRILIASIVLSFLAFIGANIVKSAPNACFFETNFGFISYADAKTNISKAQISDIKSMAWTGAARKAKPRLVHKEIKLKLNKDYVLSYKSNIEPGTAKVIINGIGKYKGSVTKKYSIVKRSVNSSKLNVTKVSKQAYTGKKIKPKVVLKYKGNTLIKDKNYKISYSKNKKIGKATITIKGKGSHFRGTRIINFKIKYSLKKKGKLKLARTSLPYTGKKRKPYVKVKYKSKTLTKDVDYKLKYSNCKKVGTAKVKVTGKGKYGFSISKTYKIKYDGGKVIDLSEWNTVNNFKKLSRKVDFAILRSWVEYSDHSGNRSDKKYDSFANGCEKRNIAYGAYGYMNYKSEKDAKKQAEAFYDASFSNGHKPLFLVLDLEDSYMYKKAGKSTAKYTLAAIKQLRTHNAKLKVGLYIGNDKYKGFGFINSDAIDEASFVWIPTYGKNNGSVPSNYSPNYAYDLWQYTSLGKVSGVSQDGGIDLSVIRRNGLKSHNAGWYLKR